MKDNRLGLKWQRTARSKWDPKSFCSSTVAGIAHVPLQLFPPIPKAEDTNCSWHSFPIRLRICKCTLNSKIHWSERPTGWSWWPNLCPVKTLLTSCLETAEQSYSQAWNQERKREDNVRKFTYLKAHLGVRCDRVRECHGHIYTTKCKIDS